MKSLREVVVTRGELVEDASDASDGHFASDGHPEHPLWIRIGSELRTVVVHGMRIAITYFLHRKVTRKCKSSA